MKYGWYSGAKMSPGCALARSVMIISPSAFSRSEISFGSSVLLRVGTLPSASL